MEGLIALDSTVLIAFFRKKNKQNIFFYELTYEYSGFVVPATVHYEIYVGTTLGQKQFWDNLFNDLILVSYTPDMNSTAINITNHLKSKQKSIDYKDLLIAATALHYQHPLATLNTAHFKDIADLKLITPQI